MAEVTRSVDQLVTSDTIPNEGANLIVESSEPAEIPTNFVGGGTIRGYKVTFTDGTFTLYPVGSSVIVVE